MGSVVIASVFLIFSPVVLANASSSSATRLPQAVTAEAEADFVASPLAVKTESFFVNQEKTLEEMIPFEKEYREDPELEYGLEKVQTPGVPGLATKTYLISYWNEEEVNRVLIRHEIQPPVSEVIARGTKIIWKETVTADGPIKYWRQLNVRATSYDANCVGCTGRTYSGTEVHHGVCAVDPKVIQLGTWFYVPGYGACHAEDIGGAIKGNKIDLGFENVSQGWWSTRYVDIYLTTGAPVN